MDMCFADLEVDENQIIDVEIDVARTWPTPTPTGRATVGELMAATERTEAEVVFALKYTRHDENAARELLKQYTEDEEEEIFGRIPPEQLKGLRSWRGQKEIDDVLLVRTFTELGMNSAAFKELLK
jgi:hypothetical protein